MASHLPEVVSFDAAGTLIRLAEPVGATYARIAARHGVRTDPDEIGRAFGRVWKRSPPPFSAPPEVSAVGEPDERTWWSHLVREVFREADAPFGDGAFADFFDELYRRFEEPGAWLAAPDADLVLTRVSAVSRCVVLSNFDGRLRRILADLGLLDPFEALFLSCEQRLSKPDPRLFARVSETLGVAPDRILHVGDDPVCDWAGAEAAGFRHFRVGRGQRPLRELLGELSLA
jgi:putative hydrolase of the HAD superfamily